MKNTLLALGILLASPLVSHAQTSVTSVHDSTHIYTAEEVEQAPMFNHQRYAKYGENAIYRFLGENFRIPVSAARAGIHGETLCSFVIDPEGNVYELKVLKSLHPEVDREALRVIRLTSGHWKPAMKGGVAVPFVMTYPYRIVVQNGPDVRPRRMN